MLTLFPDRRRNRQDRPYARGEVVRKDFGCRCVESIGNCRPKCDRERRTCIQLGTISKDPIGFAAGDANQYRYVGNGPTNATDPSGLVDSEREEALKLKLIYEEERRTGVLSRWKDWDRIAERNANSYPSRIIGGTASTVSYVFHLPTTMMAKVVQTDREGLVDAFSVMSYQSDPGGYYNRVETYCGVEAARQVENQGFNPKLDPHRMYYEGSLTAIDFGAWGGIASSARTLLPRMSRPTAPSIQPRSNEQLINDIAARANRWGIRRGLPELGSRSGTLKHGYADRFLVRYQQMFGDRGLSTEIRYINGHVWRAGVDPLKGSVRLDVVEGPLANPIRVYDYKFGNAALTPARIGQIRAGAGLNCSVPVTPVSP